MVKSLEAALWAFYKTDSFREGALLAVNLGNDADITGAIYGQLAGSFYGMEGNPGRMDIQTLPEGYDPFLCRQAL